MSTIDDKVLVLFKIILKEESDYFLLDSKDYSPYADSEIEIVVQDGIKLQIIEIANILHKDVQVTQITLKQR